MEIDIEIRTGIDTQPWKYEETERHNTHGEKKMAKYNNGDKSCFYTKYVHRTWELFDTTAAAAAQSCVSQGRNIQIILKLKWNETKQIVLKWTYKLLLMLK